MTERVKHICRRALPQGNELCLRLNLCPAGWMLHLGESFGTALVLWQCRLVWLSEKASGSFSPAGTENNRAMFYDILQGKHRWGQGRTTWEGSQAFVQSLWGVTHPSERSHGQQADCPVFWHHRNLPSLFCGSGPSPGKPKARLVTFPDDYEQTKLLFISRKIALPSEWPLFLLRKVANTCWLLKVKKA